MWHKTPIPLYYQLATELESQIVSGNIKIGSYLPSEPELARRFAVSLITVRSAMRVLLDRGLVQRRAGKGTVVMQAMPSAVWELGWLSDLVTSVMPSRLAIVAMGRRAAPNWVQKRLDLAPGMKVHGMTTVRHAIHRADEPFMTTELYHPNNIGSALRRRDFESAAAGARLVVLTVEKKCGLQVTSVRQTMTAELADPANARLLQIKRGMPLLVVMRDYFDANGRLIQTGKTRYRTDHYEYVLKLSRGTSRAGVADFRAGSEAAKND